MNFNPVRSKAREFEIVMAEVPFSTCRGTKVRPFLVWRDIGLDYWGFPLTSHSPRNSFEVALEDWWMSGLNNPGTVRVSAGCPVAKERVSYVIGKISDADAEKVVEAFATLFGAKHIESNLERKLGLAFA